MKYQISTLDVWGNEDDGFEINNWFNYDVIDADDLDNWDDFCRQYLVGDPKQYEIDSCSCEGFFEIRHIDTGKPVLHLQKTE